MPWVFKWTSATDDWKFETSSARNDIHPGVKTSEWCAANPSGAGEISTREWGMLFIFLPAAQTSTQEILKFY